MDCGDEETGIEVLITVQDIGGRCAMMHPAYGLPMSYAFAAILSEVTLWIGL